MRVWEFSLASMAYSAHVRTSPVAGPLIEKLWMAIQMARKKRWWRQDALVAVAFGPPSNLA
jgi:hypothetical protein